MIVSFQLSMPNSGSWNGKWTGGGQPYFILRKFRKKDKVTFLRENNAPKNFYYNFEDGWGANVKAEVITAKEATKRRKASHGFCSYDWMVDEIIQHGRIIPRRERIKLRREQAVIEAAPEMLKALREIIKAQFDKETSLAGLNGVIAKAEKMLKSKQIDKDY